MFITTEDAMKELNYEKMVDGIMEKYEFNPFEHIETIVNQENWCIVTTYKLLPTLLFMQRAWRRLWWLESDDIDWIERNILTFYKPKSWDTKNS